jgi:hypothetical protein
VDSKAEARDKSNLVLPLAIIAALVPIVGGTVWYMERHPAQPPEAAPLTGEAKAYVRNLKLANVEMKATASYVGSTVVEVLGQITNNGDRALQRVELTCVFYDVNGLVVYRERVPIVKTTLKPGETRSFRLPFEGIPQSWNQVLPSLVIANIAFG